MQLHVHVQYNVHGISISFVLCDVCYVVLTFNSETRCVIGWLIISYSTCVQSSQSPSHSQSVSVLSSHWVIQDSLISFCDSDRVQVTVVAGPPVEIQVRVN